MHPLRASLAFTLLGLGPALLAQVPGGWNAQLPLGQEEAPGASWFGCGLWAADHTGPATELVDSLGLGNAITGFGFHLEGGVKTGQWDLAAETLGVRDGDNSRLTLYRAHGLWRSREDNGWSLGLEQEPLVWGYGLNGGYLLGEADRPFPRFRVESPMKPLGLFGVPLGTWGFQVFMGRMESERVLSPLLQDGLYKAATTQNSGDPQGPFLNGYRFQARFGESVEFYGNYLNLWGGTVNGIPVTRGYSLSEYITAMFGLKDTLAEANTVPNDPNGVSPYKNSARSASEADLGLRIRLRRLGAALGTETAYFYVSRGTKNLQWSPGIFLRNPLKSIYQDVSTDVRNLVSGRVTRIWNATSRLSVPNLSTPNDGVGLLLAWPRVRLGLEYLDTVNNAALGVRAFGHYIYTAGFYYYGDPLGESIAGEARTWTLRLERDLSSRLATETFLHVGGRTDRDPLSLFQQVHPGQFPAWNRFQGLEENLKARLTSHACASLGAYWERQSAVDFVPATPGNAWRWYADLSFRWPAARPGTR